MRLSSQFSLSKNLLSRIFWFVIALAISCSWCDFAFSQESSKKESADHKVTPSTLPERSRTQQNDLKKAIIAAFAETHDGFSSDEVIINKDLNAAFVAKCKSRFPKGTELEFNWLLLNLRKAGKLTSKATKRAAARRDEDQYRFAAEIAMRSLQDRFQYSSDRILADPILRKEFGRVAGAILPDVEPYDLRKAALRLRKTRKLKPELILRIADWGRKIEKHPANELSKNTSKIPEKPGVYIFSDSTGYLYIGEASNLRDRLSTHLEDSDRKSLAKYLVEHSKDVQIEFHAFDPESKAKSKSVRRAYESELIRSRKPRLNVKP